MEMIQRHKNDIKKVIFCEDEILDLLFIALLAEGHILLESVPGTGKTKLAKSFATVINGQFSRVQFTPDVLPSDITGIRFFNPKTQQFELRVGPVHTNVLLADEINRAMPKTQAGLLEAMEEFQATIDGETIGMKKPFLVIATQNPVEQNYGTFPLPEAQLDRFLFKINLGYPTYDEDKLILQAYRRNDPLKDLQPSLSIETILTMQTEMREVTVGEAVSDYIVKLVHHSRNHEDVELGISTRGMLALMRAAQARAYLGGRKFVSPEDVKMLVPYVFGHRILLTMDGAIKKSTEAVIDEIIKEVTVPVESEVR